MESGFDRVPIRTGVGSKLNMRVRANAPCFRAPSPARMKEISLESTM